jgi:CheY-like chemotaxis protein/signal transduction histidine kinase
LTRPVVLVVDDNATTRKLVRATLVGEGYEVAEAADGAAALAAAEHATPDLVLLDVVLPDLSGFEVAHRLRALSGWGELPILAFTAFSAADEDAGRLVWAGFTDVVLKPVEPARLVQALHAYLPLHAAQKAHTGTGRRVLVVDDEPLQRKLLRVHLVGLGYEVAEAADGAAALDALRAAAPDAVLSDVLMPGMDGFDLCRAIRAEPGLAALPVVLMSSHYSEEADRQLSVQSGANALTLRSPSFGAVLDALDEALQGKTPPPPAQPGESVAATHLHRVIRQLERQVAVNAGLAQRSSLQSAELSVLSGISGALAHGGDIDAALAEVLAACLDAGGLSLGVLYVRAPGGAFEVRATAGYHADDTARLGNLFGHGALLDAALERGDVTLLPSAQKDEAAARALLRDAGFASAMLVPILYRGERLGVLLMGARGGQLERGEWATFARTVANQLGQAIVLARAFAAAEGAEREAQEKATVLRSVLESMADGVVVVDGTGRLILWNAAADALLAEGPRDVAPYLHPEVWPIYAPDGNSKVPPDQAPLARALRGESIDAQELLMRPPTARREVRLSVNARPLRDEAGAPRGAVAVWRDVTAERAAQAQLLVADRMASVGTLAAGVAHEINNPLASVIANLGLAVEEVRALNRRPDLGGAFGELEAELTDAAEAAERVRLIVRDLKIFSRGEEDRRGPVDVHAVLDSALRMAWNEVRHRAQVVKAYGEVPSVDANASRLGQVFLNLIVNAAQSFPAGKADLNQIRLRTHTSEDAGGRVVVEVEDTGPGMPPEILARLFTPFYSTKAVGAGTGLGLSICQRLVSGLGGEITVRSRLGEGTTFRVALPLAASSPEAAAPSATATAAAAPRRGRVLVVDDEELIGSAVRRILGREHEVRAVTRAQEALAAIEAGERWDLILCDLMMPIMTGMDLHAALSAAAPEQAARMVFLTGGAFTTAARAFLDAVPNVRMDKPFDAHALRAFVNERLRGS